MLEIKKALPKYLEIVQGEREPRFKQNNSLDVKIELALNMLDDCNLCKRSCHVDRTEGELGYCGLGNELSISGNYVDYDEDISLFVPSYNVFFLGCILKCAFCQNWETSQNIDPEKKISEKKLAKIIDSRTSVKILDFVGGDPVPQLPFALKTLSHITKDIPVIWNSSFYMTPEAMFLLEGSIDVYSPDFKYGNDECAERISDVKNYTGIVKRNHILAFEDSEMITRHLVMPNHMDCCSKPIMDFLADTFGDKVLVHIIGDYTPQWKARQYPDINRKIRKKEFQEVVSYAEKKGLNYILE